MVPESEGTACRRSPSTTLVSPYSPTRSTPKMSRFFDSSSQRNSCRDVQNPFHQLPQRLWKRIVFSLQYRWLLLQKVRRKLHPRRLADRGGFQSAPDHETVGPVQHVARGILKIVAA